MKLSDVIALIGAGYTKAEIDALEAGTTAKETPETEAKPEPKENPDISAEEPNHGAPEDAPAGEEEK